ncbi:TIGR02391 family protein [Mesorhizobium sp. LHD-90]|uniref:TIGR02391 family protein n=1 Tax=Mesorhizobium sp. LHD-90 TaxID=3071414 RepID=UPI0027E1DCE0|nr:TIGR02391 family protein [Mesorhizobium sp. LHD-90]MDQ6433063.1 TIGR02391 family protein [Mesorhizobium sp. LHD-90]
MARRLDDFERIARQAYRFTEAASPQREAGHPFDSRNLHSDLPPDTRRLFDNGHFAQSTFEAFKFVDEEMQRISNDNDFGTSLMMRVLGGVSPAIKLTPMMTETEKKEQEGFKFLFAGGVLAIRNPRAHKSGMSDDPDTCLDHLTFASMLLRKLDEAGLR